MEDKKAQNMTNFNFLFLKEFTTYEPIEPPTPEELEKILKLFDEMDEL